MKLKIENQLKMCPVCAIELKKLLDNFDVDGKHYEFYTYLCTNCLNVFEDVEDYDSEN